MEFESVGREIAQGLVRVATFDQRQPLGQEPFQLDRLHFGPVLLTLAALLRLFVVVELALDAADGAVEDVDDAPEQVFQVGLEAGVLQGGGEGVEGVGDRGAHEVILGKRSWVGFALERAVAEELEFGEEVGGRALGVIGFVVFRRVVVGHRVRLRQVDRALRGLVGDEERGRTGPAPRGSRPRPKRSGGRRARLSWLARNDAAGGRGRKSRAAVAGPDRLRSDRPSQRPGARPFCWIGNSSRPPSTSAAEPASGCANTLPS